MKNLKRLILFSIALSGQVFADPEVKDVAPAQKVDELAQVIKNANPKALERVIRKSQDHISPSCAALTNASVIGLLLFASAFLANGQTKENNKKVSVLTIGFLGLCAGLFSYLPLKAYENKFGMGIASRKKLTPEQNRRRINRFHAKKLQKKLDAAALELEKQQDKMAHEIRKKERFAFLAKIMFGPYYRG